MHCFIDKHYGNKGKNAMRKVICCLLFSYCASTGAMELDMPKNKEVPSLIDYALKTIAHSLADAIEKIPSNNKNTQATLAATFAKIREMIIKVEGTNDNEPIPRFGGYLSKSIKTPYYQSCRLTEEGTAWCYLVHQSRKIIDQSDVITVISGEYDVYMGLLYALAHKAAENKGITIPISKANNPDWYQAYKRLRKIQVADAASCKKSVTIKR